MIQLLHFREDIDALCAALQEHQYQLERQWADVLMLRYPIAVSEQVDMLIRQAQPPNRTMPDDIPLVDAIRRQRITAARLKLLKDLHSHLTDLVRAALQFPISEAAANAMRFDVVQQGTTHYSSQLLNQQIDLLAPEVAKNLFQHRIFDVADIVAWHVPRFSMVYLGITRFSEIGTIPTTVLTT